MCDESGTDIEFKGKRIDIKNEAKDMYEEDNLDKVNSSKDLACGIYTSGSTGKPKVLQKNINL